MILKVLLVLFMLLSAISGDVFANTSPEIGKPMPDFYLSHIKNFKTKNARSNDFRGKWLFIDFWSKRCSNCLKSFPKMNAFQEEFKDNLQIVLLGMNSREYGGNDTETLYDNLIKKYKYNLPSAFDSVLAGEWGVEAMPHIFIIDPEGILRYITPGMDLTSKKIASIIKQKEVIVDRVILTSEVHKPLFPPPPEGTMYSCVLRKSKGENFWVTSETVEDYVENTAKIRQRYGYSKMSCSLIGLYRYAYSNWVTPETSHIKYHPRFILEMKDSSAFKVDYTDYAGLYNFHLWVDSSKSADLKYVKSIFQQELKNVFGFEVVEKERLLEVWELKAKPGAADHLKAKGGYVNVEEFNRAIKNVTVDELLAQIRMGIYNQREEAFIDKTGITGKIDIQLEGFSTDLEDVKRSLQKNGLELVRAKKRMKVLVIRNAVSEKRG